MINPNSLPNSNRSKKRHNRNFVSLEVSSRKHRRAKERSMVKRTFDRVLGDPGQVMEHHPGLKTWMCKAGGSKRYY